MKGKGGEDEKRPLDFSWAYLDGKKAGSGGVESDSFNLRKQYGGKKSQLELNFNFLLDG